MLYTKTDRNGIVSAPHHLAAEAGAAILRDGGNAIEAMVAAAATVAVVYPHMNSIGGDGFWLIHEPGRAPMGIEACGPSAANATHAFYRDRGLGSIPARGPEAALTVAGTIGGWKRALDVARTWSGSHTLPLPVLLAVAVDHARKGVRITEGQASLTTEKLDQLVEVPGFAATYLAPDRTVRTADDLLVQSDLAGTLDHLARAGLDDFYRGDVGKTLAQGLENLGSPLSHADLQAYSARQLTPLSLSLSAGQVYNMPPPTQGVASLMILGLFDRLRVAGGESFAHLHGLIEATKRAFLLRNAFVTDPDHMTVDARTWLEAGTLDCEAARIDPHKAAIWPHVPTPGDTIWMGAADKEGRVVSFIQSIFWEYGSGVVVPGTGVVWQNRGMSFSLDPKVANVLEPGKRPFHTLNPALAVLNDGRVLAYGTMGGEGQPQTQAAIFTRHVLFGMPMDEAVAAPRWLLGRTWGEESTNLKLENRFDAAMVQALIKAGHEVELVDAYTSTMGHAGMVAAHPDGTKEGACDPRSDGGVCE